MTEIHDDMLIPCAQCCKKHLSAAIAHYADIRDTSNPGVYWKIVFARAMIALCEATEGYESHYALSRGLMVRAEHECPDPEARKTIREYRLYIDAGKWVSVPSAIEPSDTDWFLAHIAEAEREFPEIRDAVEREPFYRDNMGPTEIRQAEVNYRLAQIRWIDERYFGDTPVEKGDAKMAKGKSAKPAVKAACKGGCAKKGSGKKGK